MKILSNISGQHKSAPSDAPSATRGHEKSGSDREERIRQTAYRRAEMHGFEGDPLEYWLAAEAEIDAENNGLTRPDGGDSATKETEQVRIARGMGNDERKQNNSRRG